MASGLQNAGQPGAAPTGAPAASRPAGTPAALSGPALVRLLTRLARADTPAAPAISDPLSQWLGWTDAIALSSVLGGAAPVAADTRDSDAELVQAYARLRDDLQAAIADDSAYAPGGVAPRGAAPRGGAGRRQPAAPPMVEFADYRQHYVFLQKSMETGIGNLRERLRAALAARSPELGRLAQVDAVMERVLGGRERSLLVNVPRVLERRHAQLRPRPADEAAAGQPAAVPPAQPPSPAVPTAEVPPWLETFRKDMRAVLAAELSLRLQPLEGLLAALRGKDSTHP